MAAYHTPKPPFSYSTHYVGLPQYFDEPSPDFSPQYQKQDWPSQLQAHVDLQTHPQMKGHRSWLKTLIIQSWCLLWALPVGLLVYFNLHGWVLGASAWCPGNSCLPQMFNPSTSVPQMIARQNDRNNHNLLGALQLVAKALEIWFILIATWLVYLVTMFLASRSAGLPIAYITRPNEFSELYGLLDPLLWKTLPHPFRRNGTAKARKRVWIFIGFTIGLCILSNFMGPATAVLVLPSLQWRKIPGSQIGVFLSQNSATPPSSDGDHLFSNLASDCTPDMYTNNEWNCTAYPFAMQMDGWVQSFIASLGALNGGTSQGSVTFGFNSTFWRSPDGQISDFLSWAPSRQTVQGLDNDLWLVQQISQGVQLDDLIDQGVMAETDSNRQYFESFFPYNNTVAAELRRDGPVMGVAANMWLGYNNATWWDSFLDTDHQSGIRCYNNYNISNTPLSRNSLNGTYTKCVKWGVAWNMDYHSQSFTIDGIWKDSIQAFGPSVLFQVWTSDKAAFFPNAELPAGLSPDCLPVNQLVPSDLDCDWDAFFATTDDSILATRSQYVNTIHLSTNYKPVDGHPSSMDLAFDWVTYLNFTTYALDPSPVSNPTSLITFPNLPMSGTAMPVDPSWILAAWSAPNLGTIAPGRAAAIAILNAFDAFWDTTFFESPDPLSLAFPYPDYIALLPIIQALSLVDQDIDTNMTTVVDSDHPLLVTNGRINVWAYGMSSRSSWFGVCVAVAGGLVAIFQFFLGLIDRRPYRSPTELLVAALEHAPPTEDFQGKNHDELAVARTPFRVEDMHVGHASSFKFHKIF